MENQKLSDFTATATEAIAADLLLLEHSSAHKKITFANLTQDLVANTPRQEIIFDDIVLTQSQIQNLNTTPIEIVPAPGAEYYIQAIGGSGFLDHNGTTYGAASVLTLEFPGVIIGSLLSFIDNASDTTKPLFFSGNPINHNVAVVVKGDVDATGNGGTIRVFFQYAKIFTGVIV